MSVAQRHATLSAACLKDMTEPIKSPAKKAQG